MDEHGNKMISCTYRQLDSSMRWPRVKCGFADLGTLSLTLTAY